MTRTFKGYRCKQADGTPSWPGVVSPDMGAAMASTKTKGTAYLVPVFAVRKPKPVVVPPLAQARAILSIDEPRPAPCKKRLETPAGALVAICGQGQWTCLDCLEPKPAPVVAAEGLFACLHRDATGSSFEAFWKGEGIREVGTREEAAEAVAKWSGRLVRILDDGEHEAAVAAAVERGRARGFGAAQALARSTANALRVESQPGALAVVKALDEVAKGQAK